MADKKHSLLYRNSLSLVMLALMLFSLVGQFITGWKDYNSDRQNWHKPLVTAAGYFTSGHFISATFENWESEFLQMALYVILTVKLRQKGSSESKKIDEKEEVDREPIANPAAPWPVRKGGMALRIYNHSLSIVLSLLFFLSFYLHLVGSLRHHNEQDMHFGKPPSTLSEHLMSSSFWFESFQNWQSEFLSVLSIVVLSIWLRQKGSPESKPVDAPHGETGGG